MIGYVVFGLIAAFLVGGTLLEAIASDPTLIVVLGLVLAMVVVGKSAMGPRASINRALRGDRVRVEFADDQSEDDEPPEDWVRRLLMADDDVVALVRIALRCDDRPTDIRSICPAYPWLSEAKYDGSDDPRKNVAALVLSADSGGKVQMDVECGLTDTGLVLRVVALRPIY